ncbi:hypothetical protein [Actinophytocola gossypii]|uniref:DUF1795 domain-containing protein n=1 Tax=Actinophytocola gossypii TaxID=2812003 RepID=A0ABT2J2G8_9PSEU|nr:hypothetical protein [Actinophytocola gossypii]MCT2582003.1 hypothetical protein [Actinophytocola gossypii]
MVGTRPPAEIEFRLPGGWEPAGEPAPDGTFAALHVASAASGFTANLTVHATNRTDGDTLPEIADETVSRLRAESPDLRIIDRGDFPDGFAQQLLLTAEVNGRTWEVTRAEIYAARGRGRTQTVLRAVLTCTVDQFAEVIPDFDAFLDTLSFVDGE